MTVNDITKAIEEVAPLPLQEAYDNAGLQVGDRNMTVTSALICLDITEGVLNEAIAMGANLVISHHPLIFSGLKSITGKNYIERIVLAAIKHDIALYAAHTNLDSAVNGVNFKLAQIIGLQQIRILQPKEKMLLKLVTFVPEEAAEKVKTALFSAGAGEIGNYEACSYTLSGQGSFTPKTGSNPYLGKIGVPHTGKEIRIEVVLSRLVRQAVEQALIAAHPYEEPAYDLIALENRWNDAGLGVYGVLPEPVDELSFIRYVSKQLQAPHVRYTSLRQKPISTVAICGGSGASLIAAAKNAGADIFITGEIKYHDFFGHEEQLILAEYGHYETEQCTKEVFCDIIMKKFPTFAVHYTKEKTNPINYL